MENNGKNLDIEVLRGVAILITIYAHIGALLRWLPETYMKSFSYFSPAVGVDLFFCISGYVITKSLCKDSFKEKGFSSLSVPFWIRRMWRLWPSSFLWLIVTIICAKLFNWNNSFNTFENNVYSSLAAFFQVANVYFTHCIQENNCGSNMVYWSLSLEEQFYFIFPFAIYFLPKKYISVIAFIAIASQFFIFRDNGSLAWTTRTDAILAGILIGMYDEKIKLLQFKKSHHAKISNYAIFIALCLALFMIPATKIGSMTGFTTMICALMVLVAAHSELKIIPDGMIKNVMIYIGGRSYAIYLAHIPVFILTYEFYSKTTGMAASSGDGWTLAAIAFPCVIIFAELNYRFVEMPLITRGKKIAQRYKEKAMKHGQLAARSNSEC